MPTRRSMLIATASLAGGAAMAQDFPPRKPVTMLVGFAPGGAADAAARLIARHLGDAIGQNVVVENKAGAGGNIAHQQAAQGPTDGSMLLLGSIGPLTIAGTRIPPSYNSLFLPRNGPAEFNSCTHDGPLSLQNHTSVF